MDDFTPYDGNDFRAWLDSLNPADRKRENIALARYHDKRQRLLTLRQLRPDSKPTGRPPDFPRERLVWFKACQIRRRELVGNEAWEVTAQIVGTYLGFDLTKHKEKSRLERLARGGDAGFSSDARKMLSDLSDAESEKLSSELLALARRDRRSAATESPSNVVSVPR